MDSQGNKQPVHPDQTAPASAPPSGAGPTVVPPPVTTPPPPTQGVTPPAPTGLQYQPGGAPQGGPAPGAPGAAPPPPPTPPPLSSAAPTGGAERFRPSKKILAIVLVVAILILGGAGIMAFLGGMGGRVSVPTRQVELTWWGLWEDESIVEPLIAEYEAANPSINITYISQSKNDYRERLTSALARGDGPDIFRLHNTWVPMFRQSLATLPGTVMSAREFSETFYPVAVSDLTTQSGIVGIPLMYDGLALYINDDIFRTFGREAPETWGELRELARVMTVRNVSGSIEQAGIAMGSTDNVDHWQDMLALMMIQNGADPTNPVGELAEGALAFYRIFANQTWDSSLPPSTFAFAGGKSAMYIGPSWEIFEIQKANPSLSFSVVSVPQLPKTELNEPDITYATYWFEGVSETSSKKQEAWEFLRFMSTRESLEKFFRSSSQVRSFGEIYPRVDMRDLILNDPFMGRFIELAPNATSWFLASRTWDGPTGLNSQLSNVYEVAVLTGKFDVGAIRQVLGTYGIVALPTPEPER